jgi:hypothetical protein
MKFEWGKAFTADAKLGADYCSDGNDTSLGLGINFRQYFYYIALSWAK